MPLNVARITRRNYKTGYGDKEDWNNFSRSVTQNGTLRCHICKRKGSKENPIQSGHQVAITKGGRNTKLNNLPECKHCNMLKRNRRPVKIFKGRW